MPSNVQLNAGAGGLIATAKQITHDGDVTQCQGVHLLGISGTEDAYTAATINGDATNGLDVDVTRVIPGVTATALGKAEDAAHASGDTGVFALAVRQDTATQLAGIDGDYSPFITDASGRLHVNVGALPALPAGTNNIGDVDVLTLPALPAGTNNIGDVDVLTLPSLPAGTNNIGDVDVLTLPGIVVEDAASAGGENLMLIGAVRQDTIAASTSLDGDFTYLKTTAAGRLYTSATIDAALPAGTNNIGDVDVLSLPAIPAGTNNIGDVDVLTVPADPFGANADAASATGSISAKLRFIAATGIPITSLPASTNTLEVVGDAAHDAVVAGNPVLIGAEARTSDGTAVASGDVVRLLATLLGKQVTYPYALPGLDWHYAAASGGIVNTTGVTARAAAGAGIRNYITRIQVINGHATVSTDFQIRDGAAGTVLWRGWLQAAGGGVSAEFDPPLRGTANTLVEIACGTTGSAVYANLHGFQAAE